MLLLPPDQQHQSTEGNQFALILGGYRTMCKINLWSTFSRNEFHLLYFYYFVCLLQYAGRTIVTGMKKNFALHHLYLNWYFPGEPGSANPLSSSSTCSVVWWCNGYDVGLATQRVAV